MRAKREITEAPVRRFRYAWPALGLALLLHGALFALLVNRSSPTPEPPPGRRSIKVTLVQAPSNAAPSASAPQVTPVAIPERESKPEPEPKVEPVPKAVSRSEDSPKPEVRTEPESRPKPEPESKPEPRPQAEPPASSSPPPANTTTARPSGRDLLAGATASVREQGFAMQPHDEPPGDSLTRAARDRYIADWTRRVEDIGNRRYPAPAHLAGQLRIRVVIRPDGQLAQAEVIQSSGHPELDRAALNAVEAAAPYRPFDQGLAGLERLEFTRTWRFGKGNNFGVH
ncbi:TonB family protein [Pistricoccus aurantiacus]|uniref:TonB family protein n=1 Tax=Pistricoccus aurantiacus TaxID=1883414 RepID=UPI003628F7C0